MYIPWNKGKHGIISKDTRIKMSLKAKERWSERGPSSFWKDGISPFKLKPGHATPHSKETKQKISISRKGKLFGRDNPAWIEDRSKLKVGKDRAYDNAYRYWMISVKRRDNHKCKIANPDCKGRLEAHHILSWRDHPELRYQTNNGITLCHFHHPKKRMDEEKLSPYFQELVASLD